MSSASQQFHPAENAYQGEGSTFGKYYLLKKIATGGMGEIFLAKLTGPQQFEKLVVIKRILESHIYNDDFLDMFFAEARIVAQLNHSHIAQIYEMGRIGQAYFIAMEYVHGKTFRAALDRASQASRKMPPHLVAEVLAKVCDGMHYAHQAKSLQGDPLLIVHRDITPHNLLLSYDGDVKIIDFGIAKSGLRRHRTQTGTIKGKFVYMSPEQSAAMPMDHRSDIFSIGICLYEGLTGTNPFIKENVVMSLDAIQRDAPPSLERIDPTLAVFDPIVSRALNKHPKHRYAHCDALAADLRKATESLRSQSSAPALEQWMQTIFPAEIQEENRWIAHSMTPGPEPAIASSERPPSRWGWPMSTIIYPQGRLIFWLLLATILAGTYMGAMTIRRSVTPAATQQKVLQRTPKISDVPNPHSADSPPKNRAKSQSVHRNH